MMSCTHFARIELEVIYKEVKMFCPRKKEVLINNWRTLETEHLFWRCDQIIGELILIIWKIIKFGKFGIMIMNNQN
jgi:hypothetical protein